MLSCRSYTATATRAPRDFPIVTAALTVSCGPIRGGGGVVVVGAAVGLSDTGGAVGSAADPGCSRPARMNTTVTPADMSNNAATIMPMGRVHHALTPRRRGPMGYSS